MNGFGTDNATSFIKKENKQGRMITPIQLKMLLHYYVSPELYTGETDAVRTANRRELIALGLLTPYSEKFTITERGKVYCEAVLAVPFPQQVWVIPK